MCLFFLPCSVSINDHVDADAYAFNNSRYYIERFSDKITRHGHLDFVGEMEFVNKPTVPNVLDDLFQGEVPKVSVERAKISLKMIIGAIQSNKENSRVQWDKIKDQNIRIS